MRPYIPLDEAISLVERLGEGEEIDLDCLERELKNLPKVWIDGEDVRQWHYHPGTKFQFRKGDLFEFMQKYKASCDTGSRKLGKLFGFELLDVSIDGDAMLIRYQEESGAVKEINITRGDRSFMNLQ